MKSVVSTLLVLAVLASATTAFAVDFNRKSTAIPGGSATHVRYSVNALLFCDDAVQNNAYFQGTNQAFGNSFNFGASSRLSSVDFFHFGFGFSGPYAYDLVLYDKASCTLITTVPGLVAADAA